MSFGIDLAPGLMTARHGLVKLKPPPEVLNSTLMVVMLDGCKPSVVKKMERGWWCIVICLTRAEVGHYPF